MSLNCAASNYFVFKSNISHYVGFNIPPPLKHIVNFLDPMLSSRRCSRRVNKSCIGANFQWVDQLLEKIQKSPNFVEMCVGNNSELNEERDGPFVVKESVMQYSDKNDRRALLEATCWRRLENRFVCLEDAKPCPTFSGSLRYEPVYPRNYTEREEKGGHQCWVKSDFDVHDSGLILADGRTLAPWHVDGVPPLTLVATLFAGFNWFVIQRSKFARLKTRLCNPLEDLVDDTDKELRRTIFAEHRVGETLHLPWLAAHSFLTLPDKGNNGSLSIMMSASLLADKDEEERRRLYFNQQYKPSCC